MKIRKALISVSDKTGIIELAHALVERGIKLLSTGGTEAILTKAGLSVTSIATYTGWPEILGGRIKTLHPRVYGGLLAQRNNLEHISTLSEYGIECIDMLIVNLYPFQETVSASEPGSASIIEAIDIGGPAMIRAAAKNYDSAAGGLTVVTNPSDYRNVISEMDTNDGQTSYTFRLTLAIKAYAYTAAYDSAIANYFSKINKSINLHDEATSSYHVWPDVLELRLHRQQILRYGENPHQKAAFYTDLEGSHKSPNNYRKLQGKELSYNNIADAEVAWECVCSFEEPACVIVKHANPCAVAVGKTALQAYQKAFKADPISAFGGIIAFNKPVDVLCAVALSNQFLEVVLAPSYDYDALKEFDKKKNVRVLEALPAVVQGPFEIKKISNGWLLQTPDLCSMRFPEMQVVTRLNPSEQQLKDLIFAWKVVKYIKSNAVIFASQGTTLGIGSGQTSRLDAARIASSRTMNIGSECSKIVSASDGFLPFRDSLDVVVNGGVTGIIQPGGSINDSEVISAADEHGITMVFTGTRHFKH